MILVSAPPEVRCSVPAPVRQSGGWLVVDEVR
jgi:hypothetical protein